MMRTPLTTLIKAALAVACSGLMLPPATFAQDHGVHGDSNPPKGTSAHGDHHGGHGNQGAATAPEAEHQHGMQHGTAPAAGHDHASQAPAGNEKAAERQRGADHEHKDAGAAPGMNMGRMQGSKAPPEARDPDAYSGGLKRQPMHGMEMADDELFGSVAINELEYVDSRHGGHGQSVDMEAWYGGDYNKLWFKAEGERRKDHLESMRTEVLWDRVFAPFWSTQLGIRHDTGQGSTRDWLAFGVRGLAPYWFHVDATLYAGGNGALAARAEARYDLLLTQRLMLQPKVEMNLYSKNDASRGIGSGLSDVELGLRLRYEIRRQFAPYVGFVRKRLYGNTADYAHQAGEKSSDTEYVAGVRFWF